MTPLLEVRQISKSFGSNGALVKASFTLHAGEIHALVGENGAGKSTLMKILSGMHGRDAGEILIDGSAFNRASPEESRRYGIGTVFQELSLCTNISVAKNISANGGLGSFGLVPHRLLNQLTNDHLLEFAFSIPADTLVRDLNLAQKGIVEIPVVAGLTGSGRSEVMQSIFSLS
jgi:ribose transport system ATP-binding protein